MNEVVAVVVTYNRKELLKECIEALLLNQKCDILIIDNASTDGTKEYIKEYIKMENIIYENTGDNLGGAGGFNYGIKEAVKLGYSYIWIMDDDSIVMKDTLERLLEADNRLKGKYGFLSSVALWKDNTICNMNIQRKTLTKNVTDFSIQQQEIIMASFVSLFLKSEIIKELGLPIKDFFIWADDSEYTRRISRKYTSYLIGESRVIHKSKNNIPANIATDELERLQRYKYLYRNNVFLYKREGIKGTFFLLAKILLHIKRVVVSKSPKKIEKIKIIICNTIKGIKFNPKIEYID